MSTTTTTTTTTATKVILTNPTATNQHTTLPPNLAATVSTTITTKTSTTSTTTTTKTSITTIMTSCASPSSSSSSSTLPTNAHCCTAELNSIEVGITSVALAQDNAATDSGRESVNEFDSSLEETQLCKKPCTGEFYISSGSQTKWYLKPDQLSNGRDDAIDATDATDTTDATIVVANVCGSGNVDDHVGFGCKIQTGNGGGYDECGPQMGSPTQPTLPTILATTLTESTVNGDAAATATESMARGQKEAETRSGIGWEASARRDNNNESTGLLLKSSTNIATTDDGMPRTSERNGLLSNLSQQLRAISSPSLTETTDDANLKYRKRQNQQQLHHEDHSLTSTSDDCPISDETPTGLTITNLSSSSSSSQNHPNARNTFNHSVGVLQKFKRTFTNFNRHHSQSQSQLQSQSQFQFQNQSQQQQQSAQNATSHCAQSTAVVDAVVAPASESPMDPKSTIQHDDLNSEANNSNKPSSNISAVVSTSTSTPQVDGASGIYRFGPLIWRSSKERRKTKYNRRDKCNSGDSGIQIELENDDPFARILGNNAGTSATAGVVALNICAEEDIPKAYPVRRSNSAKAASIVEQENATFGTKTNLFTRIEFAKEREAPESLPTRSFSQPNGLDTCGIGRGVSSFYPIYAEVLYNFSATGPQELGLERGTLIEILRKEVGPWWFGRIKKDDLSLVKKILDPELGWFPKEFVRVIHCPDTDAFYQANIAQRPTPAPTKVNSEPSTLMGVACPGNKTDDYVAVDENNVTTIVIESSSPTLASASNKATDAERIGTLAPSRSLNIIMDTVEIVRKSAIQELLDTEINYVKLLASMCEGFLPVMSKRIDIFTPNSIRLIFSNMTAIYKFQKKFLEALRIGIEQNQIAKVFIKMHKGFLCYSTYCNAYPRALIELESYDRVKEAKVIFENCREAENLPELPLSAHLLGPVQRICRYPLHLSEILKTAAKKPAENFMCDVSEVEQTEISQMDLEDNRESIEMALEAMKSITEAVNEGKRHSETIARHQASFQNFKGPPLHLHSTRFFIQIDATRQKQNLWNSSYTLFLFDNQLVYCKRDIIKRSQFIYKGRIFLDRCRVVNVRDGKMFGHSIKNSLRIYCEARDKWYDFSFRSSNRKHRFLNTLALERQFGGKALYVSEMTGFEYAFEDRDCSDQSDYDLPDSEGNGLTGIRYRQYVYDANNMNTNATNTGTSASGESSVPDSPAKSQKYSETLPKKSQSRELYCNTNNTSPSASSESQTSSLGRRRLGNWFRKPKSTNSTPIQSPTHKATGIPTAELRKSLDTVTGGLTNELTVLTTAITTTISHQQQQQQQQQLQQSMQTSTVSGRDASSGMSS